MQRLISRQTETGGENYQLYIKHTQNILQSELSTQQHSSAAFMLHSLQRNMLEHSELRHMALVRIIS